MGLEMKSILQSRPRFGLLFGLVTAVVLAACGNPATANSNGSSGVTLKVGVYPAVGDDVLLKAAGLDNTPYHVTYVTLATGGLQTQAANQGTIDIGRGSVVANVLFGAGSVVNFASVATLKINTNTQSTVVLKDSKVKTVADLKGRKVAFPANTTAQYFLLRQLADAGLSSKDVTLVQLDPATALAALLSRSVDAYAGFGTTIDAALAHGAVVLADGGPYLVGKVGALVGSYNAYGPSLKDPAKAAAMVDFIARVQTALAWSRSHAEAWATIQSNATKQPYNVVLSTYERGEKAVPSWVGPVLPEAIANQQDIADVFYHAGVIAKQIDAKATYSTQLDANLAAAEASWQSKYPSWFVAPAWAS